MGWRKFFVFMSIALFDYIVVLCSIALGFFIRYLFEAHFEIEATVRLVCQKGWFIALFAAFFVFLFYLRGLYRKRIGFWDETKEIVRVCFVATVSLFFAAAFFKLEHSLSRIGLAIGIVNVLLFVPLFKLWLKKRLYKAGVWREGVLLIGGERALRLAAKLEADSYLGYTVVKTIDSPDNLFDTLQSNIDTVIVCADVGRKELMELQKRFKNIIISPEIDGMAVLNTEFNYSFDERTFFLTIKNNLKSQTNILIKRLIDIFIVALLLPILLPVIAILALIIRLDSGGAAIFTQKRLGEGGKEFFVYKFRSMYENSDETLKNYLQENEEAAKEWAVYKKIRGDDPRVTKVGRWIRALSLDELPQIFNVIKGEMSIVGPRPYLPSEAADMGYKKEYILEAKPGITGLWQVSGRNELTFHERLGIDVWYTLNWSVWLDVVILLKTVRAVVKKSGAY